MDGEGYFFRIVQIRTSAAFLTIPLSMQLRSHEFSLFWKNIPLHPFNLDRDDDGQNDSETGSRSGSEAASCNTSAAAKLIN